MPGTFEAYVNSQIDQLKSQLKPEHAKVLDDPKIRANLLKAMDSPEARRQALAEVAQEKGYKNAPKEAQRKYIENFLADEKPATWNDERTIADALPGVMAETFDRIGGRIPGLGIEGLAKTHRVIQEAPKTKEGKYVGKRLEKSIDAGFANSISGQGGQLAGGTIGNLQAGNGFKPAVRDDIEAPKGFTEEMTTILSQLGGDYPAFAAGGLVGGAVEGTELLRILGTQGMKAARAIGKIPGAKQLIENLSQTGVPQKIAGAVKTGADAVAGKVAQPLEDVFTRSTATPAARQEAAHFLGETLNEGTKASSAFGVSEAIRRPQDNIYRATQNRQQMADNQMQIDQLTRQKDKLLQDRDPNAAQVVRQIRDLAAQNRILENDAKQLEAAAPGKFGEGLWQGGVTGLFSGLAGEAAGTAGKEVARILPGAPQTMGRNFLADTAKVLGETSGEVETNTLFDPTNDTYMDARGELMGHYGNAFISRLGKTRLGSTHVGGLFQGSGPAAPQPGPTNSTTQVPGQPKATPVNKVKPPSVNLSQPNVGGTGAPPSGILHTPGTETGTSFGTMPEDWAPNPFIGMPTDKLVAAYHQIDPQAEPRIHKFVSDALAQAGVDPMAGPAPAQQGIASGLTDEQLIQAYGQMEGMDPRIGKAVLDEIANRPAVAQQLAADNPNPFVGMPREQLIALAGQVDAETDPRAAYMIEQALQANGGVPAPTFQPIDLTGRTTPEAEPIAPAAPVATAEQTTAAPAFDPHAAQFRSELNAIPDHQFDAAFEQIVNEIHDDPSSYPANAFDIMQEVWDERRGGDVGTPTEPVTPTTEQTDDITDEEDGDTPLPFQAGDKVTWTDEKGNQRTGTVRQVKPEHGTVSVRVGKNKVVDVKLDNKSLKKGEKAVTPPPAPSAPAVTTTATTPSSEPPVDQTTPTEEPFDHDAFVEAEMDHLDRVVGVSRQTDYDALAKEYRTKAQHAREDGHEGLARAYDTLANKMEIRALPENMSPEYRDRPEHIEKEAQGIFKAIRDSILPKDDNAETYRKGAEEYRQAAKGQPGALRDVHERVADLLDEVAAQHEKNATAPAESGNSDQVEQKAQERAAEVIRRVKADKKDAIKQVIAIQETAESHRDLARRASGSDDKAMHNRIAAILDAEADRVMENVGNEDSNPEPEVKPEPTKQEAPAEDEKEARRRAAREALARKKAAEAEKNPAPAPAPNQGGDIVVHDLRTGQEVNRIPSSGPTAGDAKSKAEQEMRDSAARLADLLKDATDFNKMGSNKILDPKLHLALLDLGYRVLKVGVTSFPQWSESVLSQLRAFGEAIANKMKPFLQPTYNTVSQWDGHFDAEDAKIFIEAAGDVFEPGMTMEAFDKAFMEIFDGDEAAKSLVKPLYDGLVEMPMYKKEAPNVPAPGGSNSEGVGGRTTGTGEGTSGEGNSGSGSSQNGGSSSDANGGANAAGNRPNGGAGGRAGAGNKRVTTSNFRITEADEIGKGTPKVKYEANIEAIRTLKQLEAEGRDATPEEQKILAKFVGWGGLSEVFNGDIKDWSGKLKYGEGTWQRKAFLELNPDHGGILTKDEYNAARKSTTNAHYTSPQVVTAIWKGLEAAGFTGGPNAKILEPAVGIGNFFGLMPDGIKAALSGIELDSLTARMAMKLYPQAHIQQSGFEQVNPPSNSYDMVISNVPFQAEGPYDPEFNRENKHSLHDFFIIKSMDKVKPGGLGVFITSTGTMDKSSAESRRKIAEQGDLLFALRLPSTTFEGNAGTSVTTDLLVFRKRAEGEEPGGEAWMESKEGKTWPLDRFEYNEYFHKHPEALLGEPEGSRTQYGGDRMGLRGTKGDNAVIEAITKAFGKLPKDLLDKLKAGNKKAPNQPNQADMFPAPGTVPDGGYGIKGGKVYRRQGDQMVEVKFHKHADETTARIAGIVGIRDAVRAVLKAEFDGKPTEEVEKLRKDLNKVYDTFVNQEIEVSRKDGKKTVKVKEKAGFLNSLANLKAFADDPDVDLIRSLEKWDYATKTATKADIFSKPTVNPSRTVEKSDNAVDAMSVVLNEFGYLNFDRMQALTGKTFEQIREELRGAIYELPDGSFVQRDEYLSGNVRKKLREAKEAAKADPRFKENVEVLEQNQPEDLTFEQLKVKLGTAWIPVRDIEAFIREIVGGDPQVIHSQAGGTWTIVNGGNVNHPNQMRYGVDTRSAGKSNNIRFYNLLQDALNLRSAEVKVPIADPNNPDKPKYVLDHKLTETARLKQQEIKEMFEAWIGADVARRDRLTSYYNQEINNLMPRRFDGSHLTFPGMNPLHAPGGAQELRPYQKDAIWRIIQTGTSLLNHAVGSGKTFEMIAAGMEMKRMGLVKKPMYVVLNSMVEQFPADILKLYPGAKVLVLTAKEMDGKNRRALLARVATGDWDAVVVTHDQFKAIGTTADSREIIIKEELESLRELLDAQRSIGAAPKTIKQIEKQISEREAAIRKAMDEAAGNRAKKDRILTFEELGVDQLFVDESHYFKNLPVHTKITKIKNVKGGDSARAVDMQVKTRFLLNRYGKGVVFATGTPVTNSISELYNLQRFLQPQLLRDRGLNHFDSWAGTFTDPETRPEMNELGQWENVTRLVKFANKPELMDMVSLFADTQTSNMLAAAGYLPRPKIKGGKTTGVSAKLGEAQAEIMKKLIDLKASITGKPTMKGEPNHASIISVAKRLSLDPRIISDALPDNPDSKVNMMIANILGVYRNSEDLTGKDGHTGKNAQAVFINIQAPTKEDVRAQRVRFGWSPEPKPVEPKPIVEDEAEVSDKPAEPEEGEEALAADKKAAELLAKDEEEAGVTLRALGYTKSKFNIYTDIVQKLVANGVPENEIAFIHAAQTPAEKRELMEKVRKGEIRILMGGTINMGVGVNIQDRLKAVHHADTPWTPDALEQANGRAFRVGNLNSEIEIYAYGTERTMDSKMFKILEKKQGVIDDAWSGDRINRHGSADVEDADTLNLSEMTAMFSGDPLAQERMQLETDLDRLKMEHSIHMSEKGKLKQQVERLPQVIENKQKRYDGVYADNKRVERDTAALEKAAEDEHAKAIAKWEEDVKAWEDGGKEGDKPKKPAAPSGSPFSFTFQGKTYTDKNEANEAIHALLTEKYVNEFRSESEKDGGFAVSREIGEYLGFKASIQVSNASPDVKLVLRGPLGTAYERSIVSRAVEFESTTDEDGKEKLSPVYRFEPKELSGVLHWILKDVEHALKVSEAELQSSKLELENAQFDLNKPFKRQEEFDKKKARMAELVAEFDRREELSGANRDIILSDETDLSQVLGKDEATGYELRVRPDSTIPDDTEPLFIEKVGDEFQLAEIDGDTFIDKAFKTLNYAKLAAAKAFRIMSAQVYDRTEIRKALSDLWNDEAKKIGLQGIVAAVALGAYAHLASGGASVSAALVASYLGARALSSLKAKIAKHYGSIISNVHNAPEYVSERNGKKEKVKPEDTSRNQDPQAIKFAIGRDIIGPGKVNLDLGGGKYDRGTKMVEAAGGTNILIDPYSRKLEWNQDQIRALVKHKEGVDSVTISSVLNVIPSEEVREAVVQQGYDALKVGGTMVVHVWDGDRSGNGGMPKTGQTWQANMTGAMYEPMFTKVFGEKKSKSNPDGIWTRTGEAFFVTKTNDGGPKGGNSAEQHEAMQGYGSQLYGERLTKKQAAFDNAMRSAEKANSAKAAVEYIAQSSDDPDFKAIAERLLPLIPDNVGFSLYHPVNSKGMNPRLVSDLNGSTGAVYRRAWSQQAYQGSPKAHIILTDRFKPGHGMNEESLLHEALHAVTIDAIEGVEMGRIVPDTPRSKAVFDAVHALDALRMRIGDRLAAKHAFGSLAGAEKTWRGRDPMAKTKEFITYGLTSNGFRNMLAGITIDDRNAWQKFVDHLRKLIGLPQSSLNALDMVIQASNKLLDAVEKKPSVIQHVLKGDTAQSNPKVDSSYVQVDMTDPQRGAVNPAAVSAAWRKITGKVQNVNNLIQVVRAAGFSSIDEARQAIRSGTHPFGPAAAAAIMAGKDKFQLSNKAAENHYQSGQKLAPVRGTPLLKWIKEAPLEAFKHHWKLDVPFLRDAKEWFRQGVQSSQAAAARAIEEVTDVIKDLDVKSGEYDLFGRFMHFRDLFEDVKAGITEFHQMTPSDVVAAYKQLRREVRKYPAVLEAIKRHDELFEDVTKELVAREKLDPALLRNHYMPHKVIDYLVFRGIMPPAKPIKTPFRGYTMERGGTERAIVTEYIERITHHLATVHRDNMIDDLIEHAITDYDIRNRPPAGWDWAAHPEYLTKKGRPSIKKLKENPPEGYVVAHLSDHPFAAAYVIPKEIDEASKGYREYLSAGAARPIKAATQIWKKFILQVKTVIGYNVRNLIGDAEKTFVLLGSEPFKYAAPALRDLLIFATNGEPHVKWPKAVQDAYTKFVGKPTPTEIAGAIARIEDANSRAVINTGQYLEEIGEIGNRPEFRRFGTSWQDRLEKFSEGIHDVMAKNKGWKVRAKGGVRSTQVALDGLKAIWEVYANFIDSASFGRENLLRLATYYANLERAKNGKPLLGEDMVKVDGLAASPNEDGLGDNRAAKIAREILGDYGNLTSFEKTWLRDALIPFYSWMKVNWTSMSRLVASIFKDSSESWKAVLARKFAMSPVALARLLKRSAIVYVLPLLWNNFSPIPAVRQAEAEAPEYIRSQWHINTGIKVQKGKETEWLYVTSPTAMNDFLEQIGHGGMGEDLDRLFRHEYTVGQYIAASAQKQIAQPAAYVWGGVNPLIKGAIASTLGKDTSFGEARDIKPEDQANSFAKSMGVDPRRGIWNFVPGSELGNSANVGTGLVKMLGVGTTAAPHYPAEDIWMDAAHDLREFNRVMRRADGVNQGDYLAALSDADRTKEAKRLQRYADNLWNAFSEKEEALNRISQRYAVPLKSYVNGAMKSVAKGVGQARAIQALATGDKGNYGEFEREGLASVRHQVNRLGIPDGLEKRMLRKSMLEGFASSYETTLGIELRDPIIDKMIQQDSE